MWRDRITRWIDEIDLGEPASEFDIRSAEDRLGHPLPGNLRELLTEFNGLADAYGTDIVWSVQQIAESNLEFRSNQSFVELYAPFDSLLFFGDNGAGDQFAFNCDSADGHVLVWDHETDDRSVVAKSLEAYVVRTLESDGEDWYR
ncbi:SMI1/KNR4 family protein [Streptomyces sp. NA02950]|uniref:SMI1/KNR4 family protein n=1 Tax=Streptomyces sp. NA02950 TaxID=2742137 RepID=UPI00159047A8|nr:SMI1/KNR4 family protein [Streptomyces sp. NA02950]QKV95686.1 SMI1/KNR4 family protein [Streptomyces sp. NA02950]